MARTNKGHPKRQGRRNRAAQRASWTQEQRRDSVRRRLAAGYTLNSRELSWT